MSIEDRLLILEDKGAELVNPEVHCVFCHVPVGNLPNSALWIAGYEFVKEILRKNRIEQCNHEVLGIESWWFADFVYGSLLSEMISNYNLDQLKLEPNRWVLSQCRIMDKAFQNNVDEHFKLFGDSLYKESEYWKYRWEMRKKFREWATMLYSDDITGLEQLQTRTDLAKYEYYNHPNYIKRS